MTSFLISWLRIFIYNPPYSRVQFHLKGKTNNSFPSIKHECIPIKLGCAHFLLKSANMKELSVLSPNRLETVKFSAHTFLSASPLNISTKTCYFLYYPPSPAIKQNLELRVNRMFLRGSINQFDNLYPFYRCQDLKLSVIMRKHYLLYKFAMLLNSTKSIPAFSLQTIHTFSVLKVKGRNYPFHVKENITHRINNKLPGVVWF